MHEIKPHRLCEIVLCGFRILGRECWEFTQVHEREVVWRIRHGVFYVYIHIVRVYVCVWVSVYIFAIQLVNASSGALKHVVHAMHLSV